MARQVEKVEHPKHYGGKDNPYEAIKIIIEHDLPFTTGNCVKYILRADKKPGSTYLEDLKKARFYLQYEIELEEGTRER
jgi:hypothetical protein